MTSPHPSSRAPLDAYRRRCAAQATGFGNESASDRSEDEPHRRCHSIAEEQAEGEGEIVILSSAGVCGYRFGDATLFHLGFRPVRQRLSWLDA